MEAQPDQGFWSPNGRADPPSPSSTEKSSPRNASQSGQAQALAWEGSPGAERAPGRQPLAAGLALEVTRLHALLGPCPHSQLRPRHGVQASGPTWLTSGLPTRWPIGRKASDAPTDP